MFYEGLHGRVVADSVNVARHADLLIGMVPVVNFHRVPCVDTANPFIAREIPAPDESMVVIRFAKPKGIDFQYLRSMTCDSFMSRANTIVVSGGKMELAIQLIFTPFVWRMVERCKRAMA